jgi:hypothetical protein
MYNYIRSVLFGMFFLFTSELDAQANKQALLSVIDSMVKEVSSLTTYKSGIPVVLGKLETYEWNLRSAYWDSIYESKGGKILRYPDSPGVKNKFCDSISPFEKTVFTKLIAIKTRSSADMLIELSLKNKPDISLYCFLLLCTDDNPKSRKILDHYLYSDAEIWIEECGERKKQKVRDFMLGRLLLCLFYEGRAPMITEEQLKTYYTKIGKEFPFKTE